MEIPDRILIVGLGTSGVAAARFLSRLGKTIGLADEKSENELGAALATIAVIIKQEFLLVIAGGIFVLETLSVIIQVYSFKLRGKRVFRMAPIHHHFELKGWNEEKIVVRFWIISVILALIAMSTLKLR